MIIASISDIHSPKYLREFFIALKMLPKVNIVLLAGDLVDRGKYSHFEPIYKALIETNVIAVFGNEDFREEREKYRENFPKVKWLDDESIEISYEGETLNIIGSEGVITKPTFWQKTKGIDENFYMKRKNKIIEMLCTSKGKTILLTHYAPTFVTVYGERESAYPGLGYNLLEESPCKPDLAIHGHAHFSRRTFGVVGKTRVYNVALPANGKFVIIEI
ncbi:MULTISPECIES: metallophosphoesterase [Acidianus]|uniref:Metallophosphoesterase n=1 Tax=Candidatus Acidianus copahuensis TaxID=1160895 RepID=A0A031LTQ9_9CREN|nr:MULTISPECIES: metallophosphoesterase [Acidianus]EZQ11115.1 metallophosphoesterase [Candidatus Acidianus copahuensis]NON62659.1 metallophosphoesterase [Acidianus sp. RZ1]